LDYLFLRWPLIKWWEFWNSVIDWLLFRGQGMEKQMYDARNTGVSDLV
jgi:hypothetical protein